MTSLERRLGPAIWVVTGLALASLAVMWVVLPPLIEDAYVGKPGALLSGVISGQKRFPLAGYLQFFQRTLLALGIAAALVGGALPWLFKWSARTRGALSARTAAVIVGVLVVLIVGLRLLTFSEPQDRDLMAYMMAADGMLSGRPLYVGIWDHKPPAVHVCYMIAAAIFGRTELALFVLGIVTVLITLWGCYRAGRTLGGVAGGVAAALVWALASGDWLLQANQPNVEVFMNVCLVWAFALALEDSDGSWRRWLGVGAGYALGTLFKPVVVAVAGLVIGTHVLVAAATGEGAPSKRLWTALRPALIVGIVGALGWVLTFGYFAVVGRFPAFEEAVFAYNRDYAGSLVSNLLASLLPSGAVIWTAAPYFPLLAVAALGMLMALRQSPRRAALVLAYLAGAWIAVAMPGRLYPHYYQLLLPPIAIAIGWIVAAALAEPAPLRLTIVGAALSLALTARVYQSLVPPAEAPVLKYGGYGYDLIETRRMGPWIAARTPPGASVYHWGADPGIYFYAGRSSPVAFLYNMPLTDKTARADRYTAQVLSELQRRPPALVVAARREFATINHPVERWIDEHYRPVDGPDGVERFVFLVPRDQAPPQP